MNNFAKPADGSMVHFFADESTTAGSVEAWEIEGRSSSTKTSWLDRPIATLPSVSGLMSASR